MDAFTPAQASLHVSKLHTLSTNMFCTNRRLSSSRASVPKKPVWELIKCSSTLLWEDVSFLLDALSLSPPVLPRGFKQMLQVSSVPSLRWSSLLDWSWLSLREPICSQVIACTVWSLYCIDVVAFWICWRLGLSVSSEIWQELCF